MKRWRIALAGCALAAALCAPAQAGEDEKKLMAVFFGRFSSYVELPGQFADRFVITLIDENPFGSLLDELYRQKTINGKPVEVRAVTRVEDIGRTDILFITLEAPRARQAAIEHAQANSILSISHAKGFAERGGIIQVDFVQQKARLKINHDAALKSNIRIGAPLLALATVIRGGAQ